MNRKVAFAMVVLASLVGAGVPVLMSGQLPGGVGAEAETTNSPSPSGRPSAVASPEGEDTAGSNRLAEDFDRLVTGEEVAGWDVDERTTLEVAALPTAVQRSARLSSQDHGTACRPLPPQMGSLSAVFMVDSFPPDDVTALHVETRGGPDVTVTISPDGSAAVMETPTSTPIEPGKWYGWSVATGPDSLTTTLRNADGIVLAEHELEGGYVLGARFCLTTGAPARVHLDSLTLENP